MSRIATIVAVCALWACAGTTSGPEQAPASEFQVPGDRISVVEFSLDDAAISYAAPYDAFGLLVAELIAAELRDLGHRAEAVPTGGAVVGDFIVSGRIARIDGGDRATRYWAGSYGAGNAKFGVEGQVEAADRKERVAFSDERWAGTGPFGGDSASLVQRCVRAVARDIAEMIHTGRFRQVR
jgi:hypothetical protein